MKVFLTGERGVGKSTIIKKVLANIPKEKQCGFFTQTQGRSIIMTPVSGGESFTVGEKGKAGYTRVFNTQGARLVDECKNDLVILDELGWMEKDAEFFTRAVEERVSQSRHVIGVLRLGCSSDVCKAIKNLPDVIIEEVTRENRDELAERLTEAFSEV